MINRIEELREFLPDIKMKLNIIDVTVDSEDGMLSLYCYRSTVERLCYWGPQ